MVEVPICLIHVEKMASNLHGIKVNVGIRVTHILFVEDINLLFGNGLVKEAKACNNILGVFCKVIEMLVNKT